MPHFDRPEVWLGLALGLLAGAAVSLAWFLVWRFRYVRRIRADNETVEPREEHGTRRGDGPPGPARQGHRGRRRVLDALGCGGVIGEEADP